MITLALYTDKVDERDRAAGEALAGYLTPSNKRKESLRLALDGEEENSSAKFRGLFALFTSGATEGERTAAERKMDAWLKRHGKTRTDIPSILVQAASRR